MNSVAFGQKWIPETVCSSDTFTAQPYVSVKYVPPSTDSVNQSPYRFIKCHTRSKIGFRVEIGRSSYHYGSNTSSWLGKHGSPNFSLALAIKKLNFGIRFKPWTIDPNSEIEFDGKFLPTSAKLNNIRLDYFIGYSIDFEKLISVEPYLGYNSTTLLVINEEELNQDFSSENTGGPIIGTMLNKYFKGKGYGYLSVFGTIGYGFVDYLKINPDLDNGYFEWSIGLALKGYATKRFNRKVE